jgi:hypothetical protein
MLYSSLELGTNQARIVDARNLTVEKWDSPQASFTSVSGNTTWKEEKGSGPLYAGLLGNFTTKFSLSRKNSDQILQDVFRTKKKRLAK